MLALGAFAAPAQAGSGLIAAGGLHTCAVSPAGAVLCWGDNYHGQLGDGTTTDRITPVPVTGLGSGVQAVAAGRDYTCALTTAGAVLCWGYGAYGNLGDGASAGRVTPVPVVGLGSGVQSITAGDWHTCALTTAGAVKCWGYNEHGAVGDGTTLTRLTPVAVVGLGSGVQAIAANGPNTCALTALGAALCWGSNSYGQVGDGTHTQRATPVPVTGLSSGVQAIAPGGRNTCALTTSGAMLCWGYNGYGEVGDGTTTMRLTPVPVAGLGSGVQAMAAGLESNCALTTAGPIFCWGDNTRGQLGDGTTIPRLTPVAVTGQSSGTLAITAGVWHNCVLTTAGTIKCWGYNGYGQLGDGTAGYRLTPVLVTGFASGVSWLAASPARNTCAVTSAGAALCWGDNYRGQLGDGTTITRVTPVQVTGLSIGVQAITAGQSHSCALTTAGAVLCWGNNIVGELGDGTTTSRFAPGPVAGLDSGVQAITAGSSHTCALTTAGAVLCWGYNNAAQLGDGTTTSRHAPVPVTGLGSGVQAITAGTYHSCALTTAGDVKCWGTGGLGDGTNLQRLTPVPVVGLGGAAQVIAAGNNYTCAVTTAGAALCWGDNFYGQLGDGTATTRLTPVPVIGLTAGMKSIAVRQSHTCALTVAGAALCWGYNSDGQLGDGTYTWRITPGAVTGLGGGVQAISLGYSHSCALASAGAALCWGENIRGQLGDGTSFFRDVPVFVLPTLSIADLSLSEGNVGTKLATFAVRLWPAPGNAVSFDTATADGTATAGSDYVANSVIGQFIAAGQTSQTFSVTINGDTDIEANETFAVGVGNVVGASTSDGFAVGSILNDDDPALSIADVSIAEGDSGPALATFTVTLSKPVASPVSFDIFTDYGSASPGSDFASNAALGQSIAAGQTSASFTVAVNGDTMVENHETFTVNLANVVGAGVADDQAQGRISNDDLALLSIDDVLVTEGNSGASTATFVVRLSSPMPNPISFDIATGAGTATAGSDYVARSQLGRYLDAGRTQLIFEVTINGDTGVEPNETFTVGITNLSGAFLDDGNATGTIANDDLAARKASRPGTKPTRVLDQR